jgi:dihydrofolate reductase
MNSLSKYVATSTLTEATWSNTTILAGDVPGAVAQLKAKPGGDLVLIGSSTLATSLATHDLIDEFRFFVVPVLLGGGTRAMDGLQERHSLTLESSQVYESGVVFNTYSTRRTNS